MQNPMSKKEVCGADASATINRADFGVNYGEKYGFKQDVKLMIQVEGSPAA
jgi:polyisoprenoid-binding protein YceI